MEIDAVNRSHYDALLPGQRDYWRWMAAPRARLRRFRALLDETPPGRLADLGCGDGTFLRSVAGDRAGWTLCGIDFSPPQIDANRRAVPEIAWRVFDLAAVGPPPEDLRGTFDAVLASEVIEHVEYPARLLTHARELARPGGRLLLSTQSGPVRETERRVGHHRHFSKEEMTDLLRAAGWETTRVWNEGYPFHDGSKWLANLAPGAAYRTFGEMPYALFQKAVCALLRAAFLFNSRSRGAQLFALARRP